MRVLRKTGRILFLFVLLGGFLLVGNEAQAQSEASKKALESVKESVSVLVEAKDEGKTDNVAFRIEAYKKVLDFSIEEAKDLKLKLLVDESNATTTPWKEVSVDTLNELISFYEGEEEYVRETENVLLEDIQKRAEELKNLRESIYLPLEEEVRSFLAIEQGKKAVQMAERRWEKIKQDVRKLEHAGFETEQLESLLGDAEGLIRESREVNKEAEGLLYKHYILPVFFSTSSDPLATSTIATSTEEVVKDAAKTTTSTEKTDTVAEEEVTDPPTSPSSIKELARESLTKIREAYQVFIEMSNLVRKLLK